MTVDTSALVAILRREDGYDRLVRAILANAPAAISTASVLEASMVTQARGPDSAARLDALIADLRLDIVPFTAGQLALAREAFRRFGKGRHPARLNFGDCITYALAAERREPLLFKGEDFSRTDIPAALA